MSVAVVARLLVPAVVVRLPEGMVLVSAVVDVMPVTENENEQNPPVDPPGIRPPAWKVTLVDRVVAEITPTQPLVVTRFGTDAMAMPAGNASVKVTGRKIAAQLGLSIRMLSVAVCPTKGW